MADPPVIPERRILTVSELTERIKRILERDFSLVWVQGEISNFRRAGSGHQYFTLKDGFAQIGAVLFRGQARRLRFDLEDGQSIVALGRVSVYEPRGTYQIILELVEPKGLGSLQIEFEQLKAKLAAEGLFDGDRKRPLPFLPRTVALVTSPSGAVVHDMLHILFQRFPNLRVQILPVRVQGAEAADEIVRALGLLNASGTAEVAVVARGGGSLEDLQAFNSEAVARAIAASRVPVVSAVGHETDFTIADFVADLRAATPTAAASAVVPEKTELQRRILQAGLAMGSRVTARLRRDRDRFESLRRRLVDPRRRLDDNRLKLDDLTFRMEKAVKRSRSDAGHRLQTAVHRLTRSPALLRIRFLDQKHKEIRIKVPKLIYFQLSLKRKALAGLTTRLSGVSPLGVLERGYSITRTLPDRRILRNAADAATGQELEVLLARGRVRCTVKGTLEHDPERKTDGV